MCSSGSRPFSRSATSSVARDRPCTPRFRDAFANTGLILNARMVGGGEEVLQILSELGNPGMKLILVSYCADTEEQKRLYEGGKSLI